MWVTGNDLKAQKKYMIEVISLLQYLILFFL